MLETFKYSGLENLYFKVAMNLGFTSKANCFRSSITVFKSSSLYLVHFSISAFHPLTFLLFLALKMNAAAAICEGVCFKKKASRRDISQRYWAKKNTWSSFAVFESFLYLYRNLYAEGEKKLNSRVDRISNSIAKTSSF